MVPFMAILSCAIVGCMLFFTINRSSEPDELFAEQNMFGMLVTVYHMTLGIGGGAELKYASPTTKVLVTLFTSFVVVVLCASAECCLLCTMPLVSRRHQSLTVSVSMFTPQVELADRDYG